MARIILIAWVLGLIALAGFFYWFIFVQDTLQLFEPSAPVASEPIETRYLPSEKLYNSAAYDELRTAINAGDTERVHAIYGELKQLYATRTPERNVVDYDHAYYTLFPSGDPLTGVDMFLRIVGDEESYDILTRALATESLGRAVGAYSAADVHERIFATEPFAEMFRAANGDVSKATIQIYEHAVAVTPTPIAAMRIAQGAARALENAAPESLTEAERSELKVKFATYLQFAEEAEALLQGKPQFNSYLADFYLIKASSFASLYFAGEVAYLAHIPDLYKKSVNLGQGNVRAFALFNYAGFLSRSQTGVGTEIDDLIRQIENMSATSRRLLDLNITNAFESKTGVYYTNARSLMDSSDAFKVYVGNLGITNVED